MRVLHLLGATEDNGGILTTLRGLEVAMEGTGVEHHVWVHRHFRETRAPSLRYVASRWLVGEAPTAVLLGRTLPAWLELRSLLRRQSYDLLHAHSRGGLPLALLSARSRLRPAICTNHAYARHTRLYRAAMRCPDLHTVLLTPNMARHYGVGLDAPNLSVISECVDDGFFELPLVPHRPRATSCIRLVGVGNIVRWKNWHLLLQAIARLPAGDRARLQFDHYGPVVDDPECRAYAAELRTLISTGHDALPCRLHGPSVQIRDLLRQADWFVLPSTNEPCSLALIEALALRLPALVSASGGNLDLVQPNRTGLHFQPDSPESLADCLRQVLRGVPGLADPLETRRSVQDRRASVVAAQYRALYERVLRQAPGQALGVPPTDGAQAGSR